MASSKELITSLIDNFDANASEQQNIQQENASNEEQKVNDNNQNNNNGDYADLDYDSDETPPPPDYVKDVTLCWNCQSKNRVKPNGKSKITHKVINCGCAIYCKYCAMKMATGVRCLKCRAENKQDVPISGFAKCA